MKDDGYKYSNKFSDQDKQIIIDLVNKYKDQTDHLLVRVEKVEQTFINIRNCALEDVSLPSRFGGSVRVLINGGWGNVSFTDLDKLEPSIVKAIKFAKLVGKGKSQYAPVKTIIDTVIAKEELKDFLQVSLTDKVGLIIKYAELIYKTDPTLVRSAITYKDAIVNELIINSEGTAIEQERPYVYGVLALTASKNNNIQNYHIKLTDQKFSGMLDVEKEIVNTIELLNKIVAAPSVKSGDYMVVADQSLAGTFIHEAFGHLSEADNVDQNPQLLSVMQIGRNFGSKLLTVIDDPTIYGERGSYKYDSEGTQVHKTTLLDKGILVGRLHSKETAARLNEKPNGYARSDSAKSIPQVRMGITYIENGETGFDQMLKGIKKGLYCIDWQAGQTDHENFTFTAQYAREIINGKLGRIVANVKLTGNLFDTLKQIDMVGNDSLIDGGTCGKGGQKLPVSSGSPHIRFKKIKVIGGE